MIKNFFKTSSTPEDLLNELKQDIFSESQVDSLANSVDIHFKNQENKTFLHCIAEHNSVESIQWLIKNKLNVDAIDNNGDTALIIASKNNAHLSVKKLLDLKANPNIINNKGRMAIHEAAKNNRIESFNILKEVTENLNHKDKQGKGILHYIIDTNNIPVLNTLMEDNKIDIPESIVFYDGIYKHIQTLDLFMNKNFNFELVDENNKNVLFYMLKNGLLDTKIIENLLSYDLDLNHIDSFGNNLLLELVYTIINLEASTSNNLLRNNLLNLIPFLMENEMDASVCNKEGENILTLAVQHRDFELVKVLLDSEVDPNIVNTNKETALSLAALIGKDVIEIIFLLMDYGASSNIRDINNKTVIEKLIDAILLVKNKKRMKIHDRKNIDETQDYYIILEEILANSEAKLRKFNTNNEPYFFEALKYGNFNIVKLLMKHGSDINQPALDGLNVIYHYMAQNTSFRREIDQKQYYANLKNIISMGADINARDDYGGITLHKAILDNDDQTIKILLNSGADMNAIDNRGRNILHNSIWKNKIKLFRLIFSYNKKLVNSPDKFGVLPINYAAFLGYDDLVLELINSGSQVNNPYRKPHYILNFLKRFHKNLIPLVKRARTLGNKQKVLILVSNMYREFKIEINHDVEKDLEEKSDE